MSGFRFEGGLLRVVLRPSAGVLRPAARLALSEGPLAEAQRAAEPEREPQNLAGGCRSEGCVGGVCRKRCVGRGC